MKRRVFITGAAATAAATLGVAQFMTHASGASADPSDSSSAGMQTLSAVNIGSQELVLVHAQKDKMVRVPLETLKGWKPASLQHSWISADERTVYIATDAVPPFTASVGVLGLKAVNWDAGTADVEVKQIIPLDAAGTPSRMPSLQAVSRSQPIMPWTRPSFTQTHGPTFLPGTNFTYVTHYTDDRVRGFRINSNGTLEQKIQYSKGDLTRQAHGVNFNARGTLGLGVGYDYDMGDVRVYSVNRSTGALNVTRTIPLGTKSRYGAFAHYATWIDNRFAYVGAMQVGPTSKTPAGATLVGPSVWLVDTEQNTAKAVIGPTDSVDGAGMFRSPSDVGVANGKLYVAEEDSWRTPAGSTSPANYGLDGFISIWDIGDRAKPRLIKRLRPGRELPADFRNAHTVTPMRDEKSVFVSSFVTSHLIRIDAGTDRVAKVYSAKDGLNMFHGEFAAGRNR